MTGNANANLVTLEPVEKELLDSFTVQRYKAPVLSVLIQSRRHSALHISNYGRALFTGAPAIL